MRYDALVGREYESGGEKKTAWTKIGVAFPTKSGSGFNVILEAIPAPRDGAYRFVLSEPREREQRGGGRPSGLDDEIPFGPDR